MSRKTRLTQMEEDIKQHISVYPEDKKKIILMVISDPSQIKFMLNDMIEKESPYLVPKHVEKRNKK